MIKKLSFCLFSFGLITSLAAATRNYELAPNLSIEYELPSKKPIVVTNYTIFNLTGTCTIMATSPVIIHAKVLNRSGSLNGKVMNKGDEDDVLVQNGDIMKLSAQPAAQVELTNTGSELIKALCKT